MSKSYGNVTDPLEVMGELGTDALRFTLLTSGTPGNDFNLALDKVESNRNFANKIWNTARFITANLDKATKGRCHRFARLHRRRPMDSHPAERSDGNGRSPDGQLQLWRGRAAGIRLPLG
jgi:valyl-tRNA synthetase